MFCDQNLKQLSQGFAGQADYSLRAFSKVKTFWYCESPSLFWWSWKSVTVVLHAGIGSRGKAWKLPNSIATNTKIQELDIQNASCFHLQPFLFFHNQGFFFQGLVSHRFELKALWKIAPRFPKEWSGHVSDGSIFETCKTAFYHKVCSYFW